LDKERLQPLVSLVGIGFEIEELRIWQAAVTFGVAGWEDDLEAIGGFSVGGGEAGELGVVGIRDAITYRRAGQRGFRAGRRRRGRRRWASR